MHVLQYSLHRLTKTRNRGCTKCSGVRGDMLRGLRRLTDEMKREERGEERRCDEMRWDGMGWDGVGWPGMGLDGIGWDGTG